jgi:PAS domain S-box-containing protein
MSDTDPVPPAADDATPQTMLEHRLSELEQERDDLRLMLDMAIEHSDTLLDSLRQENYELMQRLAPIGGSIDLGATQQSKVGEDFQLVAEALPIGLIIARIVDGHIVYGNPATCKLLGVSAEQLGKQKITDFCHSPEASQQLVSAMLTQQTFRGELRWSQPNGSCFDATVSLQPFVFKDEQAVLTVFQTATTLNH